MVKKMFLVMILGLVLAGCITPSRKPDNRSVVRYNTEVIKIYEVPDITFKKMNVKNTDFPLYIGLIIAFGLAIRAVMSIFKAAAVVEGEVDTKGHSFSKKYKKKKLELFTNLFLSQEGNSKLDDYFLPTLLGAIELSIYPVLIVLDKWLIILAWLLIKTMAHWDRWQKSHAPYTRFLVGNALVIILALYLTKFIIKI